MNYIELSIDIPEEKEYVAEIVIAFLAEQSYESFTETKACLLAYISKDSFDEKETSMLMQVYGLHYSFKEIEQQNWNKEWEENYQPIVVKDKLAIKAPFHSQDFDTEHIVIIEPKMSFGTGHHATTYMMCDLLSEYSLSEASVLDMGCGTGVLGIYASLLGADSIIAIDIDEWAYENTIENAVRNSVNNVTAIRGNVSSIPQKHFDFILANINLNILKKDISQYAKCMSSGSILMLSGFFETELNQINKVCSDNGLFFVKSITRDNWIACEYKM